MARKKKGVKKKSVRRSSSAKASMVDASKRKIKLILSNLFTFLIISLVSLGAYYTVSDEFFMNLFWIISVIAGFIAVAFLITYLVFMFLKYLKK